MAFLPVAATALSVLGTGAQALAASNTANFQARLAEVQARQKQEQASVKAGEVASETKQRLAAGRAGALQNGFELTGSVGDLLDQTERQGTLDYLTAVYDGSVQAAGLKASANLYRRQASNALVSGVIGMGSQALGGASQIYKMRGNAVGVSGT